jgi:APA family basic amino acid/polyamine antiporter
MSLMSRLFATKSLDELIAGTKEEGHQLKKTLGPWNLIALGIGAIIGAGIFATIGTAAAGDAHRPGAGPALMLSFVLTAVVCGFSALCYAEFASMVPVAGSAYTYSFATLGELIAWIIGWDLIIEYAIGNVAVAISWANYMNTLLEGFGIKLPPWMTIDYTTAAAKMPQLVAAAPHIFGIPIVFNILAGAIVAAITVVLVWGIRESASFNFGMVAIKLVVLGFFVLVSFKFVKPAHWHPFAPNGIHGVITGAAIVFFAYIGFDAVSTTAEEAKNPKRNMPIGIIGSLIICTIIYAIIAAVFTGMIPYGDLVKKLSSEQAEPLTMAMKYATMPVWMVGVVAFGSVVAHTAVLLVFQLGQPRIFFAMSRDGLLPPFFSRVHRRFQTPHIGTIITGVGVGVTAMFTSLDEMVDLTNVGTLFAFILVCMGIMVLRVKDPGRSRPFRVPSGIYLVPVLGILSVIVLTKYLPPTSGKGIIVWLIVGLGLVLAYILRTYLLPILGVLSCLGLAYYLPPSSWMRFVVWLVFGLELYAAYGLRALVYRGRLRRAMFAVSFLTTVLLGTLLFELDWHYWESMQTPIFAMVAIIAGALVALGIAVVRRLHDLDRPGHDYWWLWVPLYNIYFLGVLLFQAGTDGPNRFDGGSETRPTPRVRATLPYDFNPESRLPESDVE